MDFYFHQDHKSSAEALLYNHILQHMSRAKQMKFENMHFVSFVTDDIDYEHIQYRAFPKLRVNSIQRNLKAIYYVEFTIPSMGKL